MLYVVDEIMALVTFDREERPLEIAPDIEFVGGQ